MTIRTPLLVTLLFCLPLAYGCSKKSTSTDGVVHETNEPTATQKVVASEGVTAVTVNQDGFSPNHVEVKRGQKTTLRFTRTADKTCATEVAFPELNTTKPLPLNQPVDIEIPSDEARTLTFQCGMGMYKSKVVVL
jgi:plastocyanin domain-containing protein